MNHNLIDPNDKPLWCEQGRQAEHEFLLYISPAYGLSARLNRLKLVDCWVPDMRVNGRLADLKTQRTPFFTAQRFGLDAQFAVTLNKIDLDRYAAFPDDLVLYFWVRWDKLAGHYGNRTYRVTAMEGVWRISVSEVLAQIDDGVVPLHGYQTRVGDTRGNAPESYVLDLGRMEHLRLATKDAA